MSENKIMDGTMPINLINMEGTKPVIINNNKMEGTRPLRGQPYPTL